MSWMRDLKCLDFPNYDTGEICHSISIDNQDIYYGHVDAWGDKGRKMIPPPRDLILLGWCS